MRFDERRAVGLASRRDAVGRQLTMIRGSVDKEFTPEHFGLGEGRLSAHVNLSANLGAILDNNPKGD
jgi:hypothetical protein